MVNELNVFESGSDPRFLALSFAGEALGRLHEGGRGSWASWWSSMCASVVQIDDRERFPLMGTAPWNNSVELLTLAPSIKERCEAILGDYGEFLPLETDRGPFWAFHCLNEVNVFDEDRTERVEWVDDASVPGGRRLLYVTGMKFIDDVARRARVFVLPEENGRGAIYFTQDVVEQLSRSRGVYRVFLENSGLTGVVRYRLDFQTPLLGCASQATWCAILARYEPVARPRSPRSRTRSRVVKGGQVALVAVRLAFGQAGANGSMWWNEGAAGGHEMGHRRQGSGGSRDDDG